MAAKNTLKYKRRRLPPLLEIVDDLIQVCLQNLQSPNFKATIGDLIKIIRLRLTVEPLQPSPVTTRWLDRIPSIQPVNHERRGSLKELP